MILLPLALALQLADLATFGLATPYLMRGIVELNPVMVAAFAAAGLAGVAVVKIGLVGAMLVLNARLISKYRPVGLRIIAVGGLIGTTANLLALGALIG